MSVTFFNVSPGNKEAVTPNPLTKEAVVFTNVTDKRLSESTKLLDFQKYVKYLKLESLKYIREFHKPVCYCGVVMHGWRLYPRVLRMI